jgi:esterase/lipase superfamily enzyme
MSQRRSQAAVTEIHMSWLPLDAMSMGTAAPREFPIIRNGELRGAFPPDPTELVVYVHGWLERIAGDAADQANAVAGAVDALGYDATVVGFTYPANLPLWHSSKAIATRKGRELAAWVQAFAAECPDAPVRIVAHSLGARPALSCLEELVEHDASVRSCSLLGAAVDCDSVTDGSRWAAGVRGGAEHVYNYHMADDNTLAVVYRSAEFGDRALGVDGACGPTPDTYADHDVAEQVTNHYTYLQEEGGCLDRVIADFE